MKLSNVRQNFGRLFEAVEFETGDGKPRYSCAFQIQKGSEQDKAVEAEIRAVALKAFNDDKAKADRWLKTVRGQKTQDCYRAHPSEDGVMVLASHRAKKDGPVAVFDNRPSDPPEMGANGKPRPARLTEDNGRLYDGCYVNATVDIYVQTTGTNQGVRCSLVAVQFSKAGDAFGGARRASADEFEAVEDGADAEEISA
jgi:hypothetical protein